MESSIHEQLLSLAERIEQFDPSECPAPSLDALLASLPPNWQDNEAENVSLLRSLNDEWYSSHKYALECQTDIAQVRGRYLRLSRKMRGTKTSLAHAHEKSDVAACCGLVWTAALIWFHPFWAIGGMAISMLAASQALKLEAHYCYTALVRLATRTLYRRQKRAISTLRALSTQARDEMVGILRELADQAR